MEQKKIPQDVLVIDGYYFYVQTARRCREQDRKMLIYERMLVQLEHFIQSET